MKVQKKNMELIKDIIEWDIVNWSEAIDYWESHIILEDKNYKCLELGGRRGGLSLWLALKNNHVICSDLYNPKDSATDLHNKYQVNSRINYEAIDATQIQYKSQFDIVIFKSILGGISRDRNDALKKKTIDEIYDSLKPGGTLLFAENLSGSKLHVFFRKRFVKWGKSWNYLHFEEIDQIFNSFRKINYITVGFFGAFGRTEKQRIILGWLDKIFNKIIPKKMKYIVIGIAEK